VCLEIPFRDGPEGACANTVTHEKKLIGAEKWKSMRPFMIMIDADSWTEIKKDWLTACRMAGPDCNVAVNSVDKVVRDLDELAKKLIPRP